MAAALPAAGLAAETPPKPAAPRGEPAPAFSLPDVEAKAHSLSDYRGQSVALFFYCGCSWCHKCALAWGQAQRGGQLPASSGTGTKRPPLTVIVYHGDAEELRGFARDTGLDLKQTVLLVDPEETVSPRYDADPCPRAFVLDAQGVIRYTNDEQGKDSYKIPAPLIVSRALEALREIARGPAPRPAR